MADSERVFEVVEDALLLIADGAEQTCRHWVTIPIRMVFSCTVAHGVSCSGRP